MKTNEQIFLQIGTSGQWGKGMERSVLGSVGQHWNYHAQVNYVTAESVSLWSQQFVHLAMQLCR